LVPKLPLCKKSTIACFRYDRIENRINESAYKDTTCDKNWKKHTKLYQISYQIYNRGRLPDR